MGVMKKTEAYTYKLKRGSLYLKTDFNGKFWWGDGGQVAEFQTRGLAERHPLRRGAKVERDEYRILS